MTIVLAYPVLRSPDKVGKWFLGSSSRRVSFLYLLLTSYCRTFQEGPTQHVPAVPTATVEWCAAAVLRLAWCETLSHCVDPSKPARFFIVSSFSMLQARNSVSKFLLWANSCSEQIWFSWAVFLYCEQIFLALSNLCVDRNCVMRPYLDWK